MAARTPTCALETMQKLAWSYLDQASRGDFGRSSVVLAKFAQAYPGVRAQLAQATGVAVSALPASLEAGMVVPTATVLGFVLSAAAMDESGRVVNPALRTAVLEIRTKTAANVGEHFRTSIDPLVDPRANLRAFVQLARSTDVERLSVALDGAIAEGFECATPSSFDQIVSSITGRSNNNNSSSTSSGGAIPTTGGRGAIEIPGLTITARSGSASMPRWVLWGAIGLGVGVAGYALYEASR